MPSAGHNWAKETGFVSDATDKLKSFINKISPVDISKAINVASDVSGTRQPMADPNIWQNYKGTDPRMLSLTYIFAPQNQQESVALINIIKRLKQYSLPTLAIDGVCIMSPYRWNIIMGSQAVSDMMRFDNAVLTNVTVNYSASGKPSFYYDGMPKSIEIALSFSESHAPYAEYFKEDYAQWVEQRNNTVDTSKLGLTAKGQDTMDLKKNTKISDALSKYSEDVMGLGSQTTT